MTPTQRCLSIQKTDPDAGRAGADAVQDTAEDAAEATKEVTAADVMAELREAEDGLQDHTSRCIARRTQATTMMMMHYSWWIT
jgi:predicted RNA-binding protein associated with RNAse of E/G family